MYRISCPSCQRVYDAAAATTCSCLGPSRTVLCPDCGECLCAAPRAIVEKFWAAAPPELQARRLKRTFETSTDKSVGATPFDPSRPVVLFADDDRAGCRIAEKVISELGCTVVIAHDGEELLDRARAMRPALVIADALMPRGDGRAVARIIKDEMPETRVVIITSLYKDARYKSEAYREFRVDEYLTKPIAPATLREIVQRLAPVAAGNV